MQVLENIGGKELGRLHREYWWVLAIWFKEDGKPIKCTNKRIVAAIAENTNREESEVSSLLWSAFEKTLSGDKDAFTGILENAEFTVAKTKNGVMLFIKWRVPALIGAYVTNSTREYEEVTWFTYFRELFEYMRKEYNRWVIKFIHEKSEEAEAIKKKIDAKYYLYLEKYDSFRE